MPDVTPIYNWPIPEDTDLVKDGALAIRNLAGAVETTVDSLPNDAGLIHIETQTASGVSAVNFNNVFSAEYTNYKILAKLYQTGSQAFGLRLRKSGTDATGSNYGVNIITQTSGTVSGLSTTTTSTTFADTANQPVFTEITLFQPFVSTTTTQFHHSNLSGTITQQRRVVGTLSVVESYDGFTIFSTANFGAGTKISVYGFKD